MRDNHIWYKLHVVEGDLAGNKERALALAKALVKEDPSVRNADRTTEAGVACNWAEARLGRIQVAWESGSHESFPIHRLLFAFHVEGVTEPVVVYSEAIKPTEHRPTVNNAELKYLLRTPQTYKTLADYHSVQATMADASGFEGACATHEKLGLKMSELELYVQERNDHGEEHMWIEDLPNTSDDNDEEEDVSAAEPETNPELFPLHHSLEGQTHALLLDAHLRGLVVKIPGHYPISANDDRTKDWLGHRLNCVSAMYGSYFIMTLPDFKVRKCSFGLTRGFVDGMIELVKLRYERGDYKMGTPVFSADRQSIFQLRRGFRSVDGVAIPSYLNDAQGALKSCFTQLPYTDLPDD